MNRRHFITHSAGLLAASGLLASAVGAKLKTVGGFAELWLRSHEK
jgi:hypothetical protein